MDGSIDGVEFMYVLKRKHDLVTLLPLIQYAKEFNDFFFGLTIKNFIIFFSLLNSIKNIFLEKLHRIYRHLYLELFWILF
jgi:hypothetical protein